MIRGRALRRFATPMHLQSLVLAATKGGSPNREARVRAFVIYTALFLAACSQGGQTPKEPSQDITVTKEDSAVKARYIEGVEAYNRGNFETAYLQLTQFANDGVPLAQTLVGTMLCLGQGVSPDCSQGARYIKLGAYQGFGPAQFQLGTLHHKALGVPYDPVEAFVWYSLAAENPTSDYELRGKATSGKRELERQLSSEQLSYANWILRDPRLLDDPTLDLTGHQQDDKDRLTHIPRELEKGSEPSTQASIQSPKYGHTGPQTELVKDVQAYLSALGYEPVPIDGMAGQMTRVAIRAFQTDIGVSVDGEVTPQLLADLKHNLDAGWKASTTTQSKGTTSSEDTRVTLPKTGHYTFRMYQLGMTLKQFREISYPDTELLKYYREVYVSCGNDPPNARGFPSIVFSDRRDAGVVQCRYQYEAEYSHGSEDAQVAVASIHTNASFYFIKDEDGCS